MAKATSKTSANKTPAKPLRTTASATTGKPASPKPSKTASPKPSKTASPKPSKTASPRTRKTASTETSKPASPKTSSTKTSKPASPRPASPSPGELASAAAIDPRELLCRDVPAFNRWRMDNLGVAIDLTGADLRGADLRNAFLAGAALERCQLDDASLGGALLAGASLAGASLRRADLRGACLGRAELVEAKLAMSPLGAALVRGASLRGASLEAARAQDAVFLDADLHGADLRDCDLRGAELRGADLTDALRGPAPPAPDDSDAILARLGQEPAPVREGLGLFALMAFLSGDRCDDARQVLSTLAEALGLGQEDLQRLVPRGRIVVESLTLTPPRSHWARRVYFALMCGLVSTSDAATPTQLQVLGHFGELLGFTNRAMARIIGDELGISLTAA